MKLLVTTKNILLLGMNGDVYHPDRPSVVKNDPFCQAKTAAGLVHVVSNQIPDAATDDEWFKFFVESDGDVDFALSAFLAKFDAPDEIKEEVKTLEFYERLEDAEARNALEAQLEAEKLAIAEAEKLAVEPAADVSEQEEPKATTNKGKK